MRLLPRKAAGSTLMELTHNPYNERNMLCLCKCIRTYHSLQGAVSRYFCVCLTSVYWALRSDGHVKVLCPISLYRWVQSVLVPSMHDIRQTDAKDFSILYVMICHAIPLRIGFLLMLEHVVVHPDNIWCDCAHMLVLFQVQSWTSSPHFFTVRYVPHPAG